MLSLRSQTGQAKRLFMERLDYNHDPRLFRSEAVATLCTFKSILQLHTDSCYPSGLQRTPTCFFPRLTIYDCAFILNMSMYDQLQESVPGKLKKN